MRVLLGVLIGLQAYFGLCAVLGFALKPLTLHFRGLRDFAEAESRC